MSGTNVLMYLMHDMYPRSGVTNLCAFLRNMLRPLLFSFPGYRANNIYSNIQMFSVSHISQCRGKTVRLFIAIFQMFTIWQKGLIICLVSDTNNLNVHCFAYHVFPCRGR